MYYFSRCGEKVDPKDDFQESLFLYNIPLHTSKRQRPSLYISYYLFILVSLSFSCILSLCSKSLISKAKLFFKAFSHRTLKEKFLMMPSLRDHSKLPYPVERFPALPSFSIPSKGRIFYIYFSPKVWVVCPHQSTHHRTSSRCFY